MIGAILGPYRVSDRLGAGGMGEVYRARDTRLQRDVAIKVLPAPVAADPDRLARFEREAQVLAALNHPHIAQIYGLEETGGIKALVLELVDGPTLADRLTEAPIPVDEALAIARQIADALEAAHEAGIIHRDLKPANIKLRPDGTVKVLDFGLAKALDRAPGSGVQASALANTPTFTAHATEAGIILGTAAYMAPEQARGRAVDKRADIWAFGVVLWEMLTGRRLFAGETISDTLAAVLTREPDWTELPAGTPPAVRRLLRRCLQRDPARRLRDAGDVRLELDELTSEPAAPAAARSLTWPAIVGAVVSAALALSLGAVWVFRQPAAAPAPRPLRLNVQLSPDAPLAARLGANAVLSPDGEAIAFVATDANGTRRRLFVRDLGARSATPLEGTDNAIAPFFSPDAQWIGYVAGDSLMKVGRTGGAPVRIASIEDGGRGATWGESGDIVYSSGFSGPLSRVSAAGGTPAALTTLDGSKNERSHRWPSFLPGGRAVLFLNQHTGQDYADGDIEVVTLADGRRKVLVRGGAYPRYAPGGWLLYVRHNVLYAIEFDPERLEVGPGPAIPVIDDLMAWTGDQESSDGSAEYSVASGGTLLYRTMRPAAAPAGTDFVWADPSGAVAPAFTVPIRADSIEISPDGRYVSIDARSGGELGIWVRDLERGSVMRLTGSGGAMQSAWSPDGRWLAYASRSPGAARTVRLRAMRSSEAERTLPSASDASGPTSWSADGRTLYVDDHTASSGDDIWAIDVTGATAPRPVVQSAGRDGGARISPDGRWLLYFSNESGIQHVYVRPDDAGRPRWQVSTDRGTQPRWSHDGRRIYYVWGAPSGVPSSLRPGAGRIMVVDVTEEAGEIRLGTPRVAYQGSPVLADPARPIYDVHPDGRLLVIRRELVEAPVDTTHVVLAFNWNQSISRLKRRTE